MIFGMELALVLIPLVAAALVFWIWMVIDCTTQEPDYREHKGRLDHHHCVHADHRGFDLLLRPPPAATVGSLGSRDPGTKR
jgi:hypothetical protein